MNRPYLLFRVDDRLLHGQVTLGWGGRWRPKWYLLVDARLALDPGMSSTYEAAAPEGTSVRVCAPEAFLALWSGVVGESGALPPPEETILLVRDLSTGATLLEAGVPGPLVLGGLHFREGAREVLPYAFLTADDARLVEELAGRGRDLVAQDLPGNERVSTVRLLQSVRRAFGSREVGRS